MTKDTRYPYTYACDYIRGLCGYGESGTKISRSDASSIQNGIAKVIGMDDEELARKLADHYKANEDQITNETTKELDLFLAKI